MLWQRREHETSLDYKIEYSFVVFVRNRLIFQKSLNEFPFSLIYYGETIFAPNMATKPNL